MSALQKVTLVRAVTPRWGLRPALEAAGLLLDCQTLDELTTVIARRIDYYNRDRQHSTIGYVAPLSYAAAIRAQL